MAELDPGAGGISDLYPDYDYASDFFYPTIPRPYSSIRYTVPDFPVGNFEELTNFVGPLAAGIFLPPVDIFSESDVFGPAIAEGSEAEWEETVFEEGPPEFPPSAPGFPTPDIDWERVYDEYVVLNPADEVAIDWGDIFGTAIGGIAQGLGASFGPSPQAQQLVAGPAAAAGPAATTAYIPAGGVVATGGGCCPSPGNGQPRYMRYCVATGTYSTIKRKRRKDLLTNGDFNNLMRIASLPNKETVKIALAAAIR